MEADGTGPDEAPASLCVLGIDPGLNIMGYGVVARTGDAAPTLVEAGVIRSTPADSLDIRLRNIYDGVRELVAAARPHPTVMAVEDLYAHYNHPRTAIIMGHARGVILLAGAQLGLAIATYPATMIKKALTGNGRASKLQMQRMVQVRLGLERLPEPPDVADALAAALCHHAHGAEAGYGELPAQKRVASTRARRRTG